MGSEDKREGRRRGRKEALVETSAPGRIVRRVPRRILRRGDWGRMNGRGARVVEPSDHNLVLAAAHEWPAGYTRIEMKRPRQRGRWRGLFISIMARLEGFEPPTTWFVARYSNPLSYRRVAHEGRASYHNLFCSREQRFGLAHQGLMSGRRSANRAGTPSAAGESGGRKRPHSLGINAPRRATRLPGKPPVVRWWRQAYGTGCGRGPACE